MEEMKIIEYCRDGLLKAGFESVGVHLHCTEKTELNIENNETKLLRTVYETSLTLLGIIDHKKGSRNLNKLDTESIDKAIEETFAIAQSSMPDEAHSFSEDQGTQNHVSGPQEADLDRIYDRTEELIELVQETYPKMTLTSEINHTLKRHFYNNSLGANLQSSIGSYSVGCFFFSKDGEKTSSFNSAGYSSNTLDKKVIDEASVATLFQQNVEQTDTQLLPEKFEGDVIITPDCSDFIGFILGELEDHSMITGTSSFKGKLNETIIDPLLSIHSNPTAEDLVGGYFITSDGHVAQDATIVDKGVLQHYLLSKYGSKKTELPKGPNMGGGWVVEPGEQSLADMIKSVKKGILLCRFSGGNPGPSGDFSGVAKNSYYIEDGVVQFPLSETMLSGNILDMFREIKGVSKETIDFGSERSPWIHVGGVTVSGQ